jgi:hypothetical protein
MKKTFYTAKPDQETWRQNIRKWIGMAGANFNKNRRQTELDMKMDPI